MASLPGSYTTRSVRAAGMRDVVRALCISTSEFKESNLIATHCQSERVARWSDGGSDVGEEDRF